MSRDPGVFRKDVEAIPAWGVDLPDEVRLASIVTQVVADKTCEIGAVWVIPDAEDERLGYMQTVLFDGFDILDTDLRRSENWFGNMLVAQRYLDEIHLVRQSRVIDYRKEGAEFDAKLANVIKRGSTLNDG